MCIHWNDRPRIRERALWSFFLAAVMILSASTVMADLTVLDFEDLASGTTITGQYGCRGALFERAFLGNDPAARSGTRVLRTSPPTAEIFVEIPLIVRFTSAQARVKMFAGSPNVAALGRLTAFDADGAVVATDGPRLVAANVFTTMFQVTVPAPRITRVELQLEGRADQAIDDLEIEGDPPPCPVDPPVVKITSPPNGAELDTDTLDIAGTVTGESLLPNLGVTLAYRHPPESTAAPTRLDFALPGSGATRQFSLPGGFGGLPLGPITITAEAENAGGVKGSATSTVTNLPAAIRARFQSQGGQAALGQFRFGLSAGDCRIAVYDGGLISITGANVTHVVRGLILTKWLSLRGAFNPTGFGCPLGEERTGPAGRRVQNFQGGRIYLTVTNATVEPVAVPAVFVDAIEKRGGEAATGVPIGDPTSAPTDQDRTWLFQRFHRPNRPDLLPSTLEIRGTPPVLSMERQSGDLTVETGGTIWERFPCNDNLGPCAVTPDPGPGGQISNAGALFCDGTTYPFVAEWVGIPSFRPDYVAVPIFGVVTSSRLAGEDNPFTHEWSYGSPPLCSKGIGCPSDWILDVRPIGPQPGAFPREGLFGEGNSQTVEIEYERFYGEFVAWMGFPAVGDLFFGAGRWIIDCGHDTYESELHPAFMYSKMNTVTRIIDPFTGLPLDDPFGGQPATRADVWVNGWFPGGNGNAIEFDIFPPPRPSPTARLTVSKPVDSQAAAGVSIEWAMRPAAAVSHVHIKFTAPLHESEVTGAGEMIWEINRGYEGQWYVYWDE